MGRYGLIAYEDIEKSVVRQLSVIINNSDMSYEFWCQQPFSGVLTIDGAVITKNLTIDSINQAKTGSLFIKLILRNTAKALQEFSLSRYLLTKQVLFVGINCLSFGFGLILHQAKSIQS